MKTVELSDEELHLIDQALSVFRDRCVNDEVEKQIEALVAKLDALEG